MYTCKKCGIAYEHQHYSEWWEYLIYDQNECPKCEGELEWSYTNVEIYNKNVNN